MRFPATHKYLTMLKAAYGGASDYKVAQMLKVTKQHVSKWSNDASGMGESPAMILADLLDLDPIIVISELNLDRAQSREARQYYEEILSRVKSSAALVLCGVAGYLAYPIFPPSVS